MIDHCQPSDELIVKCQPFDQLDNHTLYDVLSLRISVFCVEQNCPYQDADGKDQNAWHMLVYKAGELAATCRILMPGEAYSDACSIGRVANHSSFRGQKIGQRLMSEAVQQCVVLFPKHPIRIGAQKYLTSFYEQFGFIVVSEPYLEDGIVHVTMERQAEQ